MNELERTINEAFNKAYPHSTPVFDEKTLCKRVNMLLDDLLCTRINFRVTNQTMCRYDRELRKKSLWHRFRQWFIEW